MQEESCDLKIRINGQQVFLLNQRIISNFSGRLRKQQERRTRAGGGGQARIQELDFTNFPGGPDGFELVARFCYNKGRRIIMTPSNICLIYCSASFLEMTEEFVQGNLLGQADAFLDGQLFYWTWEEILTSVKTCEQSFDHAESSGLLQRLLSFLVAKIWTNSELPSTSSSSSSPDFSRLQFSPATKTPDTMRPCSTKEWWFEDLTILHPKTIEKLITSLGTSNRNLTITRFLLHYLNKATSHGDTQTKVQCGGLADMAVHGVVLMGRKAFSCRGLFWVLRILSGLGMSKDCRQKLETLMGSMLDQAKLDDLLVCGHGPVYDVSLVLRLARIFVNSDDGKNLKKVGRLLDMYLREISPDQSLKVGKFLGLAESLPDSARDCYDGVYRAIDIYLQKHPTLSAEDKARLCRCLNYKKLTPEACRDLAKNPRIPPRAAVQALLVSRHSAPKLPDEVVVPFPWPAETRRTAVYYKGKVVEEEGSPPEDKEEMRQHLQKMKWKVVELEKKCRDMKGQMSMMAKENPAAVSVAGERQTPLHRRRRHTGRGLPRLC